jgi:hypothetical protein
VFLPIHQTVREPIRRSHRAPTIASAGDDRSQLDQAVGEAPVNDLKIEMDPRAMVADLPVDEGVALRCGEAAKLRMTRP